jgi:AraC-like DNA-binding protein
MKKYFTLLDPVVPMQHPRLVVETAVSQGADREALLEGMGITLESLDVPEARISYAQFAVLTGNALRLTRNRALGLDVGRNVHLSHMGVLGLALMSSPTLGTALETGIRHYRSLAPHWDIELSTIGDRVRLDVREAIALQPFRVFVTDALVVALHALAQRLGGPDVSIAALRLNYPAPDHAARYAEFCAAPPIFEHELTQIEFDAALWTAPVAGADPATYKLAEQFISSESAGAGTVDGIVAQVRRLLGARRIEAPDLESVARALQTSTRSLRRGLQQMGTSFQELLDEQRRARAVRLVRSTELTFEEIAKQAGFSDVRSFRRAFKRWTGRTPNSFRVAGDG